MTSGAGEMSVEELHQGSGLSRQAAQVLQVLAKTFGQGVAFSREQLVHEVQGQLKTTSGRRSSDAGAAIETSKALAEMERHGIVRRVGHELGRLGRAGPERFALTEEGAVKALGDRVVSAENEAEGVLAREIARLEAPPELDTPVEALAPDEPVEIKKLKRARKLAPKEVPVKTKAKKPKKSASKKGRAKKGSKRKAKKPSSRKRSAKKPKKPARSKKSSPAKGRARGRRPFVYAGKQGLYFEDALFAPEATRRRARKLLDAGVTPGGARKLSKRERTALGAVAAGSLPIKRNVISMLGTLGFNPIVGDASSSVEGPLLRFLEDKPIGFKTTWGELPAWVREHEAARATAEAWARRNGAPLARVPIEKVAPRGIFDAIGIDVRVDYAPGVPSKRAGAAYAHFAGDQGANKKPTTPTALARDVSTGLLVHVPRKGSDQRVEPDGIHG